MLYSPHVLQKLVALPPAVDEYGRPVKDSATEEWLNVCSCRCDHTTTREVVNPDGKPCHSEWHIVCACRRPAVAPGEMLRCVEDDGNVRALGTAISIKTLNYLDYAEIYM